MKLSLQNRVVVTGIGVVSPVGSDVESFWKAIRSDTPPTHGGRADFSGHINDFGPVSPQTKKLIRKSLKLMNRETQLGVAAAQHAITASGILDASYDPDRVGVVFGAGNVGINQDDFAAGVDACRQELGDFDPASWGRFGVSHVDPLWLLRVLPNMPACHAAIANDFRGPNNTITQATVATNMAINEARHAIIDGDADAMVVGGTGTRLTPESRQQAQSDCLPAEASAAFVLERLDAAIDRDAVIFGEILAASSATTIHRDHRADPQAAIEAAMDAAIEQSGISAQSVERLASRAITNCIGDAEAGSSAVAVAASLLPNLHGQTLDPQQADAASKSVVANVSAMPSGLASCVLIGLVAHRVAA